MRLLWRKSFYTVVMLFLISWISFIAIVMAPQSAFSAGELNPAMGPEQMAHLNALYGFDKPWFERYTAWVLSLLHGDLGVSFSSGDEVSHVIMERLGITLLLNALSLVTIFLLALPLGVRSGRLASSRYDRMMVNVALATYAMPSVYLALILLMILAVGLGWFPLGGLHSFDAHEGTWGYYFDYGWHLILPLSVMIIAGFGSLFLYVRSLSIEIYKSDYLFFARSRGLSERKIFWFYLMPNLAPPVVTMLGLSLPGLIGGSVILESLFGIHGMGMLFFQSALSRDYPVIMGILMMTALLTLIGNILADLILLKLNPHARSLATV